MQIRSGDQHPKIILPTQQLAATDKSTYFRPASPTQEIREVSCKNTGLHNLQVAKEDRKVRGVGASLQLGKPRVASRRPNNRGSRKGTLTCTSPRRNRGNAKTKDWRGYHPVQIRSKDRHSKNSTPTQQPEATNTSTHYRPTSCKQKIRGANCNNVNLHTLQLIRKDKKRRGEDASLQIGEPRTIPHRPSKGKNCREGKTPTTQRNSVRGKANGINPLHQLIHNIQRRTMKRRSAEAQTGWSLHQKESAAKEKRGKARIAAEEKRGKARATTAENRRKAITSAGWRLHHEEFVSERIVNPRSCRAEAQRGQGERTVTGPPNPESHMASQRDFHKKNNEAENGSLAPIALAKNFGERRTLWR